MRRPIHFEILAEDPEKVADFYRSVFGWEIATWGSGDQTYWLVTTGPEGTPGINGGIMHRAFPQAVINTLEVESLEEMLKQVEAAGARRCTGRTRCPGWGCTPTAATPKETSSVCSSHFLLPSKTSAGESKGLGCAR